jgi:hypothetical protein
MICHYCGRAIELLEALSDEEKSLTRNYVAALDELRRKVRERGQIVQGTTLDELEELDQR